MQTNVTDFLLDCMSGLVVRRTGATAPLPAGAAGKVLWHQCWAEGGAGPSKEELEAARAEVTQLTERCAQLRQMNEELLAMLERMYANMRRNTSFPAAIRVCPCPRCMDLSPVASMNVNHSSVRVAH